MPIEWHRWFVQPRKVIPNTKALLNHPKDPLTDTATKRCRCRIAITITNTHRCQSFDYTCEFQLTDSLKTEIKRQITFIVKRANEDPIEYPKNTRISRILHSVSFSALLHVQFKQSPLICGQCCHLSNIQRRCVAAPSN